MFYAVAKGYNIGIYTTWENCKNQINGFKGAIYKKFDNEKDAENYILNLVHTCESIYERKYKKFSETDCDYYVYTDGSCINNGKINPIAGIGIYFNENDNRNVSSLITHEDKLTNNIAELMALIKCYEIVKHELDIGKKICIFTDSQYSIKCATFYGEKNEQLDWKKDIPNKNLVKELYNIYKNNNNLLIEHVKAHTNKNDHHSIGNKNADKLAYKAIQNVINSH